MRTNKPVRNPQVRTHEGGPAENPTALKELRRTLSTCLLFENTFYESGAEIAERLMVLAGQVSFAELAAEVRRAKLDLGLRHAPLWMAVQALRYHKGAQVGDLIYDTIHRADEIAESLAMYWRKSPSDERLVRRPLAAQLKRALAESFYKFDAYGFAKYNRDGAVKLRDVMFMVHPAPRTDSEAELFKQIAEDALPVPDTWEVALSGGQDKKATWERLLRENKLGALALIRNLRNMDQVGVDRDLVLDALQRARTQGILPYQFVMAAKMAPGYARGVEGAMLRSFEYGDLEILKGTTVLLTDVSCSMDADLSNGKSTRIDAAGALAIGLAERCEDLRVFTFSESLVEIGAYRGFGLMDAIQYSQLHGGTLLGRAVSNLNGMLVADRIVVITDEQAHDDVPPSNCERAYVVNVAPYQYGIDTQGKWIRVNGFSPAVVDWIAREEQEEVWKD